jgi:hypothetical protein
VLGGGSATTPPLQLVASSPYFAAPVSLHLPLAPGARETLSLFFTVNASAAAFAVSLTAPAQLPPCSTAAAAQCRADAQAACLL